MEKRCKRCNKPIKFIATLQGSWMPVDPEAVWIMPREGGRIAVLHSGGGIYRGEKCGAHAEGGVMGYIPHFVTCMEVRRQRAQRREIVEIRKELGEPARRPGKRKKETKAERPPEAEMIALF